MGRRKPWCHFPMRYYDDDRYLGLTAVADRALHRMYMSCDRWGRGPAGDWALAGELRLPVEEVRQAKDELVAARLVEVFMSTEGIECYQLEQFDGTAPRDVVKNRKDSDYDPVQTRPDGSSDVQTTQDESSDVQACPDTTGQVLTRPDKSGHHGTSPDTSGSRASRESEERRAKREKKARAREEEDELFDQGGPGGLLSVAAMQWCGRVADRRRKYGGVLSLSETAATVAEDYRSDLLQLQDKPGFADCAAAQPKGKLARGRGRGPIAYLAAMVAGWTPDNGPPKRVGARPSDADPQPYFDKWQMSREEYHEHFGTYPEEGERPDDDLGEDFLAEAAGGGVGG